MTQIRVYVRFTFKIVLKEMAPYMLFSGKQADDLGFPKMCNDNGMSYTTVEL